MEQEEGGVQKRYRALRKQLDELGYRNILSIDALPLVERLVSDLLHTTESLRHYKELAQENSKERCFFEKGTEPYRLENARLVRECNELHLKTLHLAEEAERTQKELKFRIRKLESENSDLSFVNSKFVSQVKALENESADKSRKLEHLQSKNLQTSVTAQGGKKKSLPTRQPSLEIDEPLTPIRPWKERYWRVCSQVKDPYIANMVEICDQRTTCLAREISRLREENRQQSDIICSMKSQLHNREKEIERLSAMLEGGRPVSAINKDYVYKDLEKLTAKSAEDIKRLEERNKELESKLRESVAHQHEAMTRALQLAERNKQLQNELHDIDRMALAVEAECSTTVKENTRKVSKIQEKLEASLNQINDLEREILELKRNNQELQADLEDHRREKHNVQKVLDSALEEKKRLTDRINNYTVIEHDLMVEIDRLTATISQQKRRIAELESRTLDADCDGISERLGNSKIVCGRKDCGRGEKLDSRRKDVSSASYRSMSLPAERSCKDRGDGPEKGILEQLQAERDYYSKAYHNLKEQLNNAPAKSDETYELRRRLSEKEQQLIAYQHKNLELCRERSNLISHLDNRDTRDSMTSPMMECPGYTVKAVLKRLERERDMARGDICRLEEERDALRERLKIATETQVSEHARLEKTIIESEDRVRRLEAERRELLTCQGSLKATINNLDEQILGLRDQLHSSQTELSQQRVLYTQIKSLHDQCERALGDCQGQLTQSELELTSAQDRIREVERDRACLDREVATLKNDRTVLRGQLAQLDQEKDGLVMNLDSKTERVAVLEQEMKMKENRLLNLEDTLTELQKKLDITLDENGAREQALRTAEREAEALRMELDTVERARENTLRENRRLQDDLASATQDCRAAARDLDNAREECEALKRQLQDYVSEIRRVEDLLAQKENERSEMLEHFRGLSMEASLLESNNHSLENEAYEKKNQLRQAQDRIIDLEQQLEMRDSLVRSYETQIAELTAHIASLETQMQQHVEQRRKTEADLTAVRDLCVKLDTQKDNMMQQIAENDVIKIHEKNEPQWRKNSDGSISDGDAYIPNSPDQWLEIMEGDGDHIDNQLEHELARLREEQELMQDHLSKDRASINSLEALLASSRQETVDQKLQNQELQSEVTRLRQKVDDLQRKLDNESAELRRYQNQASDYGQQVAELQRQITNERFERARTADESRSDPSKRVTEDAKESTKKESKKIHKTPLEAIDEKSGLDPVENTSVIKKDEKQARESDVESSGEVWVVREELSSSDDKRKKMLSVTKRESTRQSREPTVESSGEVWVVQEDFSSSDDERKKKMSATKRRSTRHKKQSREPTVESSGEVWVVQEELSSSDDKGKKKTSVTKRESTRHRKQSREPTVESSGEVWVVQEDFSSSDDERKKKMSATKRRSTRHKKQSREPTVESSGEVWVVQEELSSSDDERKKKISVNKRQSTRHRKQSQDPSVKSSGEEWVVREELSSSDDVTKRGSTRHRKQSREPTVESSGEVWVVQEHLSSSDDERKKKISVNKRQSTRHRKQSQDPSVKSSGEEWVVREELSSSDDQKKKMISVTKKESTKPKKQSREPTVEMTKPSVSKKDESRRPSHSTKAIVLHGDLSPTGSIKKTPSFNSATSDMFHSALKLFSKKPEDISSGESRVVIEYIGSGSNLDMNIKRSPSQKAEDKQKTKPPSAKNVVQSTLLSPKPSNIIVVSSSGTVHSDVYQSASAGTVASDKYHSASSLLPKKTDAKTVSPKSSKVYAVSSSGSIYQSPVASAIHVQKPSTKVVQGSNLPSPKTGVISPAASRMQNKKPQAISPIPTINVISPTSSESQPPAVAVGLKKSAESKRGDKQQTKQSLQPPKIQSKNLLSPKSAQEHTRTKTPDGKKTNDTNQHRQGHAGTRTPTGSKTPDRTRAQGHAGTRTPTGSKTDIKQHNTLSPERAQAGTKFKKDSKERLSSFMRLSDHILSKVPSPTASPRAGSTKPVTKEYVRVGNDGVVREIGKSTTWEETIKKDKNGVIITEITDTDSD